MTGLSIRYAALDSTPGDYGWTGEATHDREGYWHLWGDEHTVAGLVSAALTANDLNDYAYGR